MNNRNQLLAISTIVLAALMVLVETLLDYTGTGIGFLLIGRHFARRGDVCRRRGDEPALLTSCPTIKIGRRATFQAVAFLVAGLLVLLSVGLLSVEATFPVRGAIQRIAEVIQFTGVISVCYLLSKNNRANKALSEGLWAGSSAIAGLNR